MNEEIINEYLKGLKWVTMYYFDCCPSWNYYYKYDHPPFMYDVYNYIKDTDKLNTYEFVDYEFLQFGDYIRFFDKKFFFNMYIFFFFTQ